MRSSRKLRQGVLFVLSGPSGSGKNTLIHRLMGEFPHVVESVSYTTRPPRQGEIEGQHYHFVSEEQFRQSIESDEFLEYAYHFGSYYGTSRQNVQRTLSEGKHVFLVIDTSGALSLVGKLETTTIFVAPPSLDELRQRLKERKAESDAAIEKRIQRSAKELKDSQRYEYIIINDDLEDAYDTLRSIVIAEVHRRSRLAEWPPSELFLNSQ